MLRRRDSSTINAFERHNKIIANEYFADVVKTMQTLLEAIEKTHTDAYENQHCHTFDKDNRVIDFVLVYDKTARRPAKEKVNQFLKILVREGFSTEGGESDIYEHLIFIRIHCHRSKLVKAGTVLDLNLAHLSEHMETLDYNVFFNFDFLFNDMTRPLEKSEVAQRARAAAFNIKPKDITNAERILVTHELLKNTRYGSDDDELGVTSLLHKKFLATCFPLHDGTWEWTDEGSLNDRQLLMKYWAHSSNWYKLQPLHLVKQYFGTEVAFYFAFLGYFNKMLIVPALCGIISLVYGVLTYSDSRNYKTTAICASKILICPPCHDMTICHYEQLDNECHTSQMAYILDNFATAIYSIFWCFWSTIIYAKWKRRQSMLLFRWNLMDMENEINIRPQFLGRAMSNKGAKATHVVDDVYLSVENQRREDTYLRVIRYCISAFAFIFLILVVLMVLYLAVIVRWWTGLIIGRFDGQFSFQWRILLVTTVGNLLVILFICVSEDLFGPLAHWITDFENPRTQEEYDQSYIYKYAVLCFITSYSFIAYTAFLKGRFFTYPSYEVTYIVFGILTYDLERIHTPMLSVSYQWTMITIGKEIWRHLINLRKPWRNRKQKTKNFKNIKPRIWEEEYSLRNHEHPFLMEENMKVMLQYGYLVLFPGANPLGPLIFFLYNIWRLRNDAQRVLLHSRRVVPSRIAGFGPWMKLIKMITILGIGTNVFLLAFTSNLVPELCHWFNPYYTNYINFTFSAFAIDDYPERFGTDIKRDLKGATCFYKGNRYPPSAPNKYENDILHWNQLSVRFLTVILVQSFVIIFCSLILFTISDIPHCIRESIRHRANLKEREREEKFRREKMKRSTINVDLRRNFTVIDY